MSAAAGMTERECGFHCLKALAKYVLVDQNGSVLRIANQDFAGLPLRLARPVRLTGQMTDNGIVISRIEPPLVHAHIGHVMTAWRDTPGTVGLLTVAASDTRVASAHALLTSKSETLDDMKLHAGHVLHAFGPDAGTQRAGLGLRDQESRNRRASARRLRRKRRRRLAGRERLMPAWSLQS